MHRPWHVRMPKWMGRRDLRHASVHLPLPERRNMHGTGYMYLHKWLERTDMLVQSPQLSWRLNMGCDSGILRHSLDRDTDVCWKSGLWAILLRDPASADERVPR